MIEIEFDLIERIKFLFKEELDRQNVNFLFDHEIFKLLNSIQDIELAIHISKGQVGRPYGDEFEQEYHKHD